MINARDLSEYVLAFAAAISTVTPIVIARRRKAKEHDTTTLESFKALNDALGREIERMGKQLEAANVRIADLEREVDKLQSTLRGGM